MVNIKAPATFQDTPHCDECGRNVIKIHRIEHEHRYCHTCYVRVFIKKLCPSCGQVARLNKNDPNAICHDCFGKKPCIRCRQSDRPIGRITIHGPVCNSCSVHFREQKPCERCGALSNRLTRVSRFSDGLKVCPRCATRDHQTCPSCRRYRLLEIGPKGSQALCKPCLTQTVKLCIQCQQTMPAGRGQQCESCYWLGVLDGRVKMNQQLFREVDIQWLLAQYACWLSGEIGSRKAALAINRHSQFFEQLADGWRGRIPSYSELLLRFRASGLRKYLLVMRWLNDMQYVNVDPKLKDDCSEQDQLDTLMRSFPESVLASNVLNAYLLHLQQRHAEGRIQLRSIRLAIKPATALMKCSDHQGESLPTIRTLRKYLLIVPGQTAAVTGFLSFLNKNYGTQLNVFDAYRGLKNGRHVRSKLESKLYELTLCSESPERELTWVQTALCYFHGLNHQLSQQVTLNEIHEAFDGGYEVVLSNQRYWIPKITN